MGNINILTASEARKIVEESEFLLKSVFKWIKDESSRNNNRLIICSDCYDKSAFETVVNKLQSCGYNVVCDENNVCTITW